jgi:hypothetical protein
MVVVGVLEALCRNSLNRAASNPSLHPLDSTQLSMGDPYHSTHNGCGFLSLTLWGQFDSFLLPPQGCFVPHSSHTP